MPCQIDVTVALQATRTGHGLKKVGAQRRRAAACALALWALAGSASALQHTTLQYTWGTFDYAFANDSQRQEITARPDYAPHNSTPFDVSVDRVSGKIILSLAAILPGSPAALATIKEPYKRDSPLLAPYPDWSWHMGQRGCDGLTSVFRSYIDKCRRLWVIDCGVVDIGNTYQQKCPPQLLAFDLRTDELIVRHRFNIAEEFAANTLLLNVIAEQVGDSCNDDAFAYIADTGAYALYVFSLRSQRSWRVGSDTFLPDSNAGTYEVNGTSFSLEDGVIALAQNDKDLYYHAFSSFQEAKVPKAVLREEALFTNGTNRASEEFKFIGSRVNQSAGEALAKNSVMFFHQMATESIYCWDTSTKYRSENQHVVEHDNTLLHFVTSVKVVSQGYPEEVWAIDNNGQRLFGGGFEPNQPYTVNIVRGSVSDLSSKCTGGWFSWIHNICNIFWW